MGRYFSAADISASGLAAERLRMEIAANNIANAYTTRTAEGGPYQRQRVIFGGQNFSNVLKTTEAANRMLTGVQVLGIENDTAEFPRVFDPGHPDADEAGWVRMPNVQLANEMVDLVTATRAYEANLQALRSLRGMVEDTISLLRNA